MLTRVGKIRVCLETQTEVTHRRQTLTSVSMSEREHRPVRELTLT